MMNPQVKAAWVAALRSGEYKQGTGALSRDGAFCCLGVLCDLHSKQVGGKWEVAEVGKPDENLEPLDQRTQTYFGCAMLPPTEVVEWAGVDFRAVEVSLVVPGYYESDKDEQVVSDKIFHLNDDYYASFEQLADAIEKQL